MSSIAILEAVNTTAVQFHGQPIITAMVAGVAYVAMRPIVESIGVDWSGQMAKLKTQREKFGCRDISTPTNGGVQNMLCIPLRKLNGWLFSINPERVRADIKDKLIQYQEECFTVLHDYWNKGEAVNPRKAKQSTAKQLTPLRQTVERLIATGMGNIYGDIWKLVHKRYEIDTINQLQPTQISEAISYLDGLEGEFIGKEKRAVAKHIAYPMEWFDPYKWIIGAKSLTRPWNYPVGLLVPNGDYPNPIARLLTDLEQAGYEVDAARFQLLALQHHLEVTVSKLDRINQITH
ncbi:phage antirepressor N-terminal domain-containing protein [Pectobacterium brasiliense]|uniref:phage antirepressor N-terminal domain-containing protein n=1 Tax=Pectobacterium brasiliense TaxID=180957 RepID=UPI00068D6438|nr:phage antirepressor N-terminal domain-containing protein [Pectobacterium brasiliense]